MLDGSKIDHLKEPVRTYGQQLLAEMERLQVTGITDDEKLWETAAANLGNDDERYCGFYICLECGCLYHTDYSSNSDPDRDFCGVECELNWVKANPDAPYFGDGDGSDEEE